MEKITDDNAALAASMIYGISSSFNSYGKNQGKNTTPKKKKRKKKGKQLVCPVCRSRRIKQNPKWEDNECLNCGRIWTN